MDWPIQIREIRYRSAADCTFQPALYFATGFRDVVAYNEAALAIAREMDVKVDDLYTVIMEPGRDRLLLSDGVHFTDEGYHLLAKAVARCIGCYL